MAEEKIRESKSKKSGLTFPVARFQSNLRKGNYAKHIGTAASVYMAGVLEYLTAEILELSGAAAKDNKKVRIIPRHIMFAIRKDAELNELLSSAFFSGSGVIPNINPLLIPKTSKQKKAAARSLVNDEDDGVDEDGEDGVDEESVDEESADEDEVGTNSESF